MIFVRYTGDPGTGHPQQLDGVGFIAPNGEPFHVDETDSRVRRLIAIGTLARCDADWKPPAKKKPLTKEDLLI